MSRRVPQPVKISPRSCGLCRFFAPWVKQSEMLGTCGGEKFGECVDRYDTCAGYELREAGK